MRVRSTIFAAILLSGCTHLEVWRTSEFVGYGSPEEQRINERLRTLYQMACKLPTNQEEPFIVNGHHVALTVPDWNGKACRRAIPIAICEVAPGEDPAELCTRIE